LEIVPWASLSATENIRRAANILDVRLPPRMLLFGESSDQQIELVPRGGDAVLGEELAHGHRWSRRP